MKKFITTIPYTLYPIPLFLASRAYADTINTAFGPFDTSPGGFVSKLFSIILSIAGIGALMLLIYGGYQYGLSQGNQEKAQQAKEVITSAIAGLLFIIFSTVILKIIGVDVLGLGSIFR